MRYTFGNTSSAAERLRKIAEFFNPLALDFIRQNINERVGSAADLGCGPGYSTQMLAEASRAEQVEGIDQSEYFIDQAALNFPELSFSIADVRKLPPTKKYDLIYSRFLLSHLAPLTEILGSWMNRLQPGGFLILDELEDVMTDLPVFKNYLHISSALIKSQGAELYVGKLLNEATSGFSIRVNQTHIIPVMDRMAAGWFYGNTIGPWKEASYIKENFSNTRVNEIQNELMRIHSSLTDETNITWKMKRIILTQ